MTLRTAVVLVGVTILPSLIPIAILAQTKSQLDRRYPRVSVYAVRPTMLMRVKFGRDARACEIVLEPLRSAAHAENLSQEEAIRVVEEVIPEKERGKRLENRTAIMSWLESRGGSVATTYQYELIAVTFSGTVETGTIATVTWNQRSCDREQPEMPSVMGSTKPCCYQCEDSSSSTPTGCLRDDEMKALAQDVSVPSIHTSKPPSKGVIVFTLQIDTSGHVACAHRVSQAKNENPLVASQVIRAIPNWRFKPYTQAGKVVAACGKVTLRYAVMAGKLTVRIE